MARWASGSGAVLRGGAGGSISKDHRGAVAFAAMSSWFAHRSRERVEVGRSSGLSVPGIDPAMEKSNITRCESTLVRLETARFEGLMSRWVMPARSRAATAMSKSVPQRCRTSIEPTAVVEFFGRRGAAREVQQQCGAAADLHDVVRCGDAVIVLEPGRPLPRPAAFGGVGVLRRL